MKQVSFKVLWVAVSLMIAGEAEALMCEATLTTGEKVYRFVGKPTKSASGVVATMKRCAEPYSISIKAQVLDNVYLEAGDIRGLTVLEAQPQLPEDRNAFLHESCRRTLDTVCDPQYGGIKLFTNPEVKNGVIEQNCIGVTIKSGQPADSAEVYYAVPMMYSGKKADGNCVFDIK